MKTISSRKVRDVLLAIGMSPARAGNGSGHDVWVDPSGRRCHPVMRSPDIAYAVLFSLGLELETKGICPRRQFLAKLRHN